MGYGRKRAVSQRTYIHLTQITRSYYKGAAGCLLVYDVTERDTFEHVPTWLHDVREQAEEHATVALVGNMADRPATQRAVSTEEAEAYAAKNEYVRCSCSLLFFETSAKTGENVTAVFTAVASAILTRYKSNPPERRRVEATIDPTQRASDNRCCSVM